MRASFRMSPLRTTAGPPAGLLAVLLIVAAAPSPLLAPALATEGPPVSVRLASDPRPARAGEVFDGTLEIVSDVKATVSGFRLEGDGWQTVRLDAPAEATMEKSGRLEIRFSAVPRDPERPLFFLFEYGQRTVRQNLDLSERHYRLMTEGGRTRSLPDGAVLFTPSRPAREDEGRPADYVRPVPDSDKGYSITVSGGWYYAMPDTFGLGWIGTDEMRVEVYDETFSFPQLLATTYTNVVGRFSVTFTWDDWIDARPDLFVRFIAESGHIIVRDHTYANRYYWQTGTWHNYEGTTLEVGGLTTAVETQMPVMHQLAGLTHVWRWHNNQGYDCGSENVYWPADAEYHSSEGIHIPSNPGVAGIIDPSWHEGGYSHEYGHHWQSVFAPQPPHDYFNGVCDGDPPTPPGGHCYWCWELGSVVVLEGFPGVLGDIIPRDLQLDYGLPIVGVDTSEMIWPCGDHWDDPNITEGFYGALLRDIWDSAQDSHGHFGAWQDRTSEGPSEILAVTHQDNPQSPMAFLSALRAGYPAINAENLWETAMNCGYDFDAAAPGVVTNLHSTSHTVNVFSADQTIAFSWTHATDDAAGIMGYGLLVSSSPSLPGAVQDIGKVTTYTTSALAPGTWYFSIRALDRAGNWSTNYASAGPYMIREAQPSDLQPHISFGWTRPLVPREDDTATGTNVPEPVTLTGNAADTYWNLNGLNAGESATGAFYARVYVDGVYADYKYWSNINAGGNYMVTNDGPLTVRGGRHTFEVFHDALEQVAETDEADNRWAHQWVWTPQSLTLNSLATRPAPPGYQAGWDAIVDGSTKSYNCDGLSFSTAIYTDYTHSWDAVYLYADDEVEDYDCRMHVHTTGATNGFTGANLGWSARGAGYLDAVLVNGGAAGFGTRDVGVLNDSGGTGNYRVMRLRAGGLSLDDSVTATLAQYEMMVFRRFDVASPDTGWYTITVSADPPAQPFQVQYYLPTFATGTISDYDARASSSAGTARMNRHLTQVGRHGLVVYRNPREGTDPCTFTIEMERTPPDLAPALVDAWHAPFVPRPLPDGTPTLVALPDTLHGNVAATYFNYARMNDSPASWTWDGSHAAWANIVIDGSEGLGGVSATSFGAYQVRTFNSGTARTLAGGRHVAAMVLDPAGYIHELDEGNNVYGEQYCWSPLALSFATPVTRAAPPDKTGGWTDITSGETRWYNCDGLRLPAGGVESWRAVGVMPAIGADVDVRLHFALTGAKSGFASSLASSAWGLSQSDFVLVCAHDFFVLPPMTVPLDAGVTRGMGFVAEYRAEAVLSTPLVPSGDDIYGPYALGAQHILQLYSLWLTPGAWSLHLDNLAGAVNWGLSLYAPDAPFRNKSGVVDGGLACLNGGGQDEWFTVDIPAEGWYCLAAWKANAADLSLSGDYQLRVHAGVTEVPEGPPSPRATALVAVHPNPFNPLARIVYDLAAAGPVRLEVYDLRGVRVRSLVSGEQTAGRHETVWDGLDETGQQAASGVYMARLAAGGVCQMRKMTLVK